MSVELQLADPVKAVFGSKVYCSRPGSFGVDRISPVDADGMPAIQVRFPAGSSSQNSHRVYDSPSGGAQLYLPFVDGPVDAVTLSYNVRFGQDFDFVKGGKLPGLYGGVAEPDGHIAASGGRIPDGTNGLSTRLMWRAAGAGEIYAYLPTSVTHGTSLGRGSWYWSPGQWQEVKISVCLNDVGAVNGSISVSIDGRPVFSENSLSFRTVAKLKVVGVFFSTFFGGADPTWASPRDQLVEFARFDVQATAGLPSR